MFINAHTKYKKSRSKKKGLCIFLLLAIFRGLHLLAPYFPDLARFLSKVASLMRVDFT